VIARQRSLEAQLKRGPFSVRERFQPDGNYGYPTYLTGYRLAAQTRDLLNLDPEEPIEHAGAGVRHLDIPLVQTKMGAGLAGATIAHGAERGIVVNIDGANENVWVRRMTLAHELGHLLWDPAEQLNRLTVDRYSDLTVNSPERRDPVEVRANAFAIALLAPPAAVDRIVQNANDIPSAVYKVSRHFGISVSAAQAHVGNISRVRVVMPVPACRQKRQTRCGQARISPSIIFRLATFHPR
jgi:Zn-dependent peptidase ImmA (M78 family)